MHKMMDYVLETGGTVVVGAVDAPPSGFETMVEALKEAEQAARHLGVEPVRDGAAPAKLLSVVLLAAEHLAPQVACVQRVPALHRQPAHERCLPAAGCPSYE